MKVVFLKSATPGLRWFHHYHARVFPEGRKKANEHFVKMQKNLVAAPFAGSPVGSAGSRNCSIPRTPFSVIYRVVPGAVEILHVIDQRAQPMEIL